MPFIDKEEMEDRIERDNLLNRLIPNNGNGKQKPIEIIDEEKPKKEFEVELGSQGKAGRKNPEMPDFLKEVIGTLGRQEDQKGIAKAFGISQPRVSQLANGKQGPNEFINEHLKVRLDAQMERVRDRAVDKLMGAMGLISEEKMIDEDAKDLSIIASNLSKVVSTTMPKEETNVNQQQVIIYAPEVQEASFYDVKEVDG